jgi:hypothetical protein
MTKPGVGIADAGGELIERARHAGVRIGAEKNFAGAGVAFLRQRRVANARVIRAVLALQQALLLESNFHEPLASSMTS